MSKEKSGNQESREEENLNCPFCGAPPKYVAGGYPGSAIHQIRSCGSNINRLYPEYTTRSFLCLEKEKTRALEAEVERLRAVIKPFANYASRHDRQ